MDAWRGQNWRYLLISVHKIGEDRRQEGETKQSFGENPLLRCGKDEVPGSREGEFL